jgi:IclR family acetate operon transcriptional repressor
MGTPKSRSVFKAFNLLNAFHRPDEWLTSCELSRRANLPIASGYRLIQTLTEVGAIVRGPRGRYRPGMLLVSLSRNVAVGELLREASHGILSELSNRHNITVHLGLLEDGMVSYVAKLFTPTSFATHTRVGAQLEAYCSGLGKVLLAALPDDRLESFTMASDLVALTPYTVTDSAKLRAQLQKVRECGFAIDDRESQANMFCVAVPVLDGEGRTLAAISATDSARRMTAEFQVEIRGALLKAAAALGSELYPVVQESPDCPPRDRPLLLDNLALPAVRTVAAARGYKEQRRGRALLHPG